MSRLLSRCWFNDLVERLADRVKDAILDLDFLDEVREIPPVESLPVLSRDVLVAALRERTEATLRDAADTINAVEPGPGWEEGQQRLAESFADLARDAYSLGLRLRAAAALHRVAEEGPVGGVWAERYRQMRLMNAAFPEPAGDDD